MEAYNAWQRVLGYMMHDDILWSHYYSKWIVEEISVRIIGSRLFNYRTGKSL